MNKKKLVAVLLCICVLISGVVAITLYVQNKPIEPIVILYENDVHCEVEGYSKLLAMKNELAETYAHVGVVSVGDFVQGGTLGAVSKGEYIVNLMNLVGYDAIALGNHEFDYQIERLTELCEMSNTKFICSNFAKIGEDESYFQPYTIVSYGNVDIAYISIVTPKTITSSYPSQFKNEDGQIIYTFNDDHLAELVQEYIDAAEKAGADYVVALSHIGYSEAEGVFDVTDIIENTKGLDVVLDAHAHLVIEETVMKDKSGEDVLLSSTGTKFEYIGQLTITEEGLHTKLIETASYETTDSSIDAYIAQIQESYAELGNRKIAESNVNLITHDEAGNRLVRNAETNLGNLCADALRVVTGAQISFVNGGGLRDAIGAGDVTFNDIYSVFPFNNQVVTAEITGQILLDMLEMAVKSYPEEAGAFPHVSGVTFSVNTAIEPAVQLDENGFFTQVTGEYRVYNVQILDEATGTYLPMDLDGKYVLAGLNYFLLDYGSGMSMFKDATILDAEGILDVEVLENFIVDHLGGVIDEPYRQVEHRITFTDGKLDN